MAAKPIDKLWELMTHDVGIDLGTANTRVSVKGHPDIIYEPSVVAINKQTREVMAVGVEARRMIGRTPGSIIAIRPLRDGVISDFDTTEAMIRYFIRKVHKQFPKLFGIMKPRVVIGIPSGITEVEARAVTDAALQAGARKVYIIEEPMAAAIGSRLPIEDASGSMIVDIGGGTTDIAVISLGGVVIDNTIRVAGDEMDRVIVDYVKEVYGLLIGEKQAEDLKIAIGSALPLEHEETRQIKGRDIESGLPKKVEITSTEVRKALLVVVDQIAEALHDTLEKAPPEILSDLLDRGIMIAGGGALIKGIDKYFQEKLDTPVVISEDPIMAVLRGTQILLDEIDLLEKIQVNDYDFI
jgi:rod shape-determining protein MreB